MSSGNRESGSCENLCKGEGKVPSRATSLRLDKLRDLVAEHGLEDGEYVGVIHLNVRNRIKHRNAKEIPG